MDLQQLLDNALQSLNRGDYSLALIFCQQAVTLEPNNAAAQSNLSYLAFLNGDLTTAIKAGARAVEIDPANADAKINYANALRTNGDALAAVEHLKTALKIDPQSATGWTQLNLAYQDLGSIGEAIRAGNTAIQSDSNLPHAYNNLALSYQQLGMIEKAGDLLMRGLTLNPGTEFLHKNYLMNLQYLPNVSSEEMRMAAQAYSAITLASQGTAENESNSNSSPVRVGFVSGDFRQHPVGIFLQSVLSEFDPVQIETHLYANQHIEDSVTTSLRATSDQWVNIQKMNDQEVVQKIKNDGIDILVDLAGHTGGSRLNIFSSRAAPIQMSWLGYFASTGVAEMDYVLLGEPQVVEGTSNYFTEQLITLACSQFCYTPPENSPDILPPPSKENRFVTFGSFNNSAKLNTEVIRVWSEILAGVNNSKLVLKWSGLEDEQTQQHFLRQFEINNIHSERLEFRGKSPHGEMLSQYNDVDIALDPFPFSGALTSCEALWMGVPVITFPQLRPVSRQTAGLLAQLDMKELIAETTNEYVSIAQKLSADTDQLENYGFRLREMIVNSSVTNGAKVAQELTRVFLSL